MAVCEPKMPGPWIAMLALAGVFAIHAADLGEAPDDAYLDNLQGSWVMEGTLGGKPVHYVADGERVLSGGFLELHMLDAQSPPQYEAQLFIGYDPKARDFIAHWLDRFGAAGARVVASGRRQGQRLVLDFPYAEGAFRDTLLWQPASASWSLLLESQRPDGSWVEFANYTLRRRAQR